MRSSVVVSTPSIPLVNNGEEGTQEVFMTDQFLHGHIQPLPCVCALDKYRGTGIFDLFWLSSFKGSLRPGIFWFSWKINVSRLVNIGCKYAPTPFAA